MAGISYLIININRKFELKSKNNSFTATNQDYENDVRFLYSACCICYILNDWSGMDKEKAFGFIMNCLVIIFILKTQLSFLSY
jgi:prenyltransferase beta subunit